jgi:hypothetical protein
MYNRNHLLAGEGKARKLQVSLTKLPQTGIQARLTGKIKTEHTFGHVTAVSSFSEWSQ